MTFLAVPGARLYYETQGSGPLLVLIPGAGGTADGYRGLAVQLATHYTVVIYDRRGFSRSSLTGPQDYSRRLQSDADDVRLLIEHLGGGPATVFGASSGAIVALELLARHRSVVRTLVPFEPPVVKLLPDGKAWLDFFSGVYDRYRASGVEAALLEFRERTFPEVDRQVMARAPGNAANAAYWFEHELRQYPAVELDEPSGPILPAVGREGQGYPAHAVAVELGRRLGTKVIELPSGHVGFIAHPAEFARELVRALNPHAADLYSSPPPWDIGRPQPVFLTLPLHGRVLDVGCGTGEHTLMAAGLGLDATGIDLAPKALASAEEKARSRGLEARFLQYDATQLVELGERFDTVLDCGLFHLFTGAERTAFVDSLRSALEPGGRYFMLGLSDRGPARLHTLTKDDIEAAFGDGWRIDSIDAATIDVTTDPGGAPAWLVTATKI